MKLSAFETHPGSVTSITTGQTSESTTSSGKRVAAAHRKTNAAICNPPGSERSSPQDGQPNFNFELVDLNLDTPIETIMEEGDGYRDAVVRAMTQASRLIREFEATTNQKTVLQNSNNLSVSSTIQESDGRVALARPRNNNVVLPDIRSPCFSGRCEEWPIFADTYTSSDGKNPDPRDVQTKNLKNVKVSNISQQSNRVSRDHHSRNTLSSKTLADKTQAYASQIQPNCELCKRDHCTQFCERLVEANQEKRINIITTAGLCSNCLRSNHDLGACLASICKVCNLKHHTLIHEGSVASTSVQSNIATVNAKSQKRCFLPTATIQLRNGKQTSEYTMTNVLQTIR
ncbi:hypothetical protein M0802_015875 [Mischocyttarus mexicanus]|nr:hypothetical protein M0802_015875 [Mischocyttarus mexicanus]